MHKIAKIITAASLTLVFSLGAVSALSQVKESKVVEAKNTSGTRTIYALTKESSAPCVHIWGSGTATDWLSPKYMTPVESFDTDNGTYKLYSVETDCNNLIFRDNGKTNQTGNIIDIDADVVYKFDYVSTYSSTLTTYPVAAFTTNKKYILNGDFCKWDYKNSEIIFIPNPSSVSGEYMYLDFTVPSGGYEVKSMMLSTYDEQIFYFEEGGNVTLREGKYNIYFSQTKRSDWLENKGHLYFEHAPTYTFDLMRGADTIRSGISTIRNPSNSSEFYTNEAFSVKAGDTLVLKNDGEEQADYTAKVNGNNNIIANKTFMFDMDYGAEVGSNRIYIDATAKTIFAGGLTHGVYGIVVDNAFHELKQDSENDSQYILKDEASLSLEKDSVVKFAHTLNDLNVGFPATFTALLETGGASSFFTTLSDNTLKANIAISVAVYFKPYSGNDQVYFEYGDANLSSALSFAKDFNTVFAENGGICDATGANTDKTKLKEAWETKKSEYSALSSEAKAYLTDENSSDYSDIIAMLTRYDYIYGKYHATLGTDNNFLARSVNTTTVSPRVINSTSNNSAALAAIVIVSSVSIVAVGFYFAIKKSRRQY